MSRKCVLIFPSTIYCSRNILLYLFKINQYFFDNKLIFFSLYLSCIIEKKNKILYFHILFKISMIKSGKHSYLFYIDKKNISRQRHKFYQFCVELISI